MIWDVLTPGLAQRAVGEDSKGPSTAPFDEDAGGSRRRLD